jgi:transcriptional regulator with XRE-family HTH domain
VARVPVEQTIRERVIALLDARPEIKDADFGERIGRGYSWVSAFRTGVRNANDVPLLMAIARFFGVTVGYLIGEKPAVSDPMLAEVVETWPTLPEKGKAAVVATVRAFAAPD